MWNFKGTLWNSTQNILPVHWKMWILFTTEKLRALIFKSSKVFLKRPPVLTWSFNSLAPGCDSKYWIFNLVLLIDIFRSSHDNALRLMPLDLTDDKSTLVQVMAWCRQATSHYLSQYWLSSLSPYGIARSQWVNPSSAGPIMYHKGPEFGHHCACRCPST